jgi:hypothetical protein
MVVKRITFITTTDSVSRNTYKRVQVGWGQILTYRSAQIRYVIHQKMIFTYDFQVENHIMPTSQSTMNIPTPALSLSSTGNYQHKNESAPLPLLDIWKNNLENTKAFIVSHSRRPNGHSRDDDEKKLGRWVTNQQMCFKKRIFAMRRNESIVRIDWEDFATDPRYSNHLIDYEGMWLKNLKIARRFVRKNYRMPVNDSIDPFEKMIGRWISNQQRDLKKGRNMMTDPYMIRKWGVFLEESMYDSPSLMVGVMRKGGLVIMWDGNTVLV